MADVSITWFQDFRTARTPYVERVLSQAERTCRKYDLCITRVIWITVAFLVWFVCAENIIRTTSIEFRDTWDTQQSTQPIDAEHTSVSSRTLFRVLRTMRDQCAHSEYVDSVIMAPQVVVNGSPFMYDALFMCRSNTELINPVVAFEGDKVGVCIDEFNGVKKKSSRRYPIAVHAYGQDPVSFLELGDVCNVMHAIDLMHAKW